MPSFFRFRSKPTVLGNPPFDYQTLEYETIRAILAGIDSWMQGFRVLCHEPHRKLGTDTAPHIFSKRSKHPKHLRMFHYKHDFMCAALFVLRQAANPMKNTTTSNFMLMVWQARYLFEKCRSAKIQGYGDAAADTVPRLAVDEDFNERIETPMHSLKAEIIAVLLDLDDVLPYMDEEDNYAGNNAGPDIASVGTRLTATEIAQHQDNLHVDPSIQDPTTTTASAAPYAWSPTTRTTQLSCSPAATSSANSA
ncbi:hypothetical protein E8E11_011544 [Didymella keratinophila]|nr:hypothetical protein E8E11_011544 [Didymella keratinophila]